MRKNRWICTAATATVAVVMFTGLPAVANAEDGEAPEPLDTLLSVTEVAASTDAPEREVLNDLADPNEITTGNDGSLSLYTEGSTTVIPGTSDEPITIGNVAIGMPDTKATVQGERIDDAVISFDGADGVTTVPVLKDDGSVQVTTIINDESAPTHYDYDLTLPDGTTLTLDNESGVVIAMDEEELVIGIAPAWAVDANGRAVATHYEIHGSTLRQIVDHTVDTVAYPVVADPWMGQQLFSRVEYANWERGAWNIKLVTSGWGRSIQIGVLGWGQGQLILNGAGWNEAVGRVRILSSRATYYQQYQCHVLGAYTPASGGPSWDLEGFRANRPWWRTDGGAYPSKCNW
ncbi:hypothetical protein IFU08_06540 [Microbacterium sp. CFBP 8790]|uniref:hypothetical protein n=1 Tax=unclassified Microbacterium TaxID=2609290 RepID=UPI00178088CC|nr:MULTISPECIES: hypothetical protein [unclassified Microbacterium]MBD8206805.1 hypothetical protein [Microbacterium sp. CFBP 8801]MBD8509224.1 hypothetical protein [Microbacterium sp. CFBP 8790]